VTESLNQLFERLRTYSPWEVLVELAIIWIVVYLVVRFLRGTRGAGMVKGLAILLVVATLAVQILGGEGGQSFRRLTYLYNRSIAFLAIAFLVIFQPELRRALIRLGDAVFSRHRRKDVAPVIEAIVGACSFLARNRIGALIAIERSVGLGGLTEGGTPINGDVSPRLLQSIFWPNSALHDLGAVIRGTKIAAAGVQFPMAEQGELADEFGSRHRAAVGITHESDCIAIVVSEERGEIRIAEWGKLRPPISPDELRTFLTRRLAESTSRTERLKRERLAHGKANPALADEEVDEVGTFDDAGEDLLKAKPGAPGRDKKEKKSGDAPRKSNESVAP